MRVYYTDHDPYCCRWLRNLIDAGAHPPGVVDPRDIRDVRPEDLLGFDRHHFSCGIAGWEHALALAGWPDDRPVWTASLPCQPFSSAGKRLGERDERHLWPVFLGLVRQCRPNTLLGEQVASADGYRWVEGVRSDLEEEGYAVGVADLPAAGVGAPHLRNRLFWVAVAGGPRVRDSGRGEDAAIRFARRNRTGRLRGYGNAIVPQVAALFVRAFLEAEADVSSV